MAKILVCSKCEKEFDIESMTDINKKRTILSFNKCPECKGSLKEKKIVEQKKYEIEFKNFTLKITLPIIIGRNYQNELKNNPYISRKHCEIVEENSIVYVIDYSTNGTFLNETKIVNKMSINNEDKIKFGNLEGIFKEIK